MEYLVNPEQGIRPQGWRIIKMDEDNNMYHVFAFTGGLTSRRSSPITNVIFQDDVAIVSTDTGSVYHLIKDRQRDKSLFDFDDLEQAVSEVEPLTPEQEIQLQKLKEEDAERSANSTTKHSSTVSS